MKRRMNLPVLFACATLLITLPALSQGPPPGGPGGPGGPGPGAMQPAGPPPDQILKEVLGFSDEQLMALHTLGETRRQAAETVARQIGDAQKALAEAMKATTPDPVTVGTLFIKIDGLQKQFRAIDETFKAGFSALLTADQRAKVDAARAADNQMKTADALKKLNVF